jgi:hypothetical protein
MVAAIEVQGYRELNRLLRKTGDKGLAKAVGRANKTVGAKIKTLVDNESTPASVGKGRGSTVRPSSAKGALKLRVGGSHRVDLTGRKDTERLTVPWPQQWGKTVVRPFEKAQPRPDIKEVALQQRDWISRQWLAAIHDEIGF